MPAGRQPVLTDAHKAKIAEWVTRGLNNDAMLAEAKKLRWRAGRTAIGDWAKVVRAGETAAVPRPKARVYNPKPRPEPEEQAPQPDLQAQLDAVLTRLQALESILAAPVTAQPVSLEEALTGALAAVTRQIGKLDIDPKALAPLVKELKGLAITVRDIRGDGEDDDSTLESV